MGRNILWSLRQTLNYRLQRLWTTFYFAQYSSKFTLLLAFPGLFSVIRYRAETKYGYHVFIHPTSVNEASSILPKPALPPALESSERLQRWFAWKNGSKFYFDKHATVHDVKLALYREEKHIPEHLMVGCKGRIFHDTDNLAASTRVYCKRDPRLVLWLTPSNQYSHA